MSTAEPGEGAPDASGAGELRQAVEEVLLGGGRLRTRRDIAERSGVGAERTAQIWRALGFPMVDDDARVFTDADVDALRAGERLIEAGLITAESETMMARALGHHLSRLAEWQVHTLWAWVNRNPGGPVDKAELAGHAAALLPEMELLQRHVWRRHLAAYAGQVLAEAEEGASGPGKGPREHGPGGAAGAGAELLQEGAGVRDRAVGFTDMVGYTRMTRGLDSTELARVLDRFESLTGDVVAEGRGRVVKTIGDEVLFVCETASAAAGIALELAARVHAEQELPRVRTGLAHGAVLSRFGDVYGAPVNIAARLTAVARPGTVLVDTAFAGELAGAAAYQLKVLRPVSVRGYSRLRPVLLRPARPGG
ncbi:adenylate/guanylate cyclase domain-containing protein [Streptomyces nitrosporeus]|uniref:Adenylate/guanylate cyclase domain-containing protein n=1 Tax=Streptomyces nitrosporeus TaxID=28894 RepID=A0A5J6F561_9ACTN|nr:adenylate/guanylate cyclase domain-containing protein [Streptomyces nitrosporeus]QEU71183.1 adenylate/guanylate cyclase domain-containing protein [Streptomyces nitrosporeus]GGZ16145.1 adenylate/guanylate cyclase domain-containing protein [Streptomyces nitrosporeus]